ncbi:MAG: D-glycero-alpha-D-manno-heptose-1,7-bisphosphate 7-phosphatase [Chitinophagales bacterium]
MQIKDLPIDKTWTLFLDRDGIINKKIDHDYVRNWKQFEFLPGVKESLKVLSAIFTRIIIVTNQRGIGKGLMSEHDLIAIHHKMLDEITETGGRVDAVFFCPDLTDDGSTHRKPKPGMAFDAKKQFPDIDFSKSIMAGDALVDMQFGKNLNMVTVLISPEIVDNPDFHFKKLPEFALSLLPLL